MDWINLFFGIFMGIAVAGFFVIMGTMAITEPIGSHLVSYMFGGLCYFCGLGAFTGGVILGLDQ